MNEYDMIKPISMIEDKILCKTTYDATLNKNKKEENNYSLKQQHFITSNITYSKFLQIFTDGSKTASTVGAAFYIPQLLTSYTYKLNNIMSNYSAELYAIYKSIVFSETLQNQNIIIFSDSQSAISAIENYKHSRTSDDIIYKIISKAQQSPKRYVLHWVPSHIGIQNNEMADQLAKQAANDGESVTDVHVPFNDFKSYRKKRHREVYSNTILFSAKAQWHKIIQKEIPKRPWFYESKLQRNEIINICKLRLGHANCNKHLHSKNMYFTPLCLRCTLGQEETLQHLFWECPSYEVFRKSCLKEIYKEYKTNLAAALSSKNDKIYKEINIYLKEINKRL
ncbi:uncharacterized protein LOC129003185 [Macrosteles quadrilineatus]|uniref:uncharacterized protein LOC129003185 n=1 Tax=Macrosteles quadrilineatus TaxID=74068 RepID=UPI0023E0DB37|nr:uncharacterized protein LOC129003185 [Macrosteles quadrilineatus]